MVTGSGMVAKRFKKYADDEEYLIFASGVSNSKTEDQEAYSREFTLLKECIERNMDKIFVYFSTTSIDDPSEKSSSYVSHKIKMEQYIETANIRYFIFRVSNLAGKSSNPNTVLNFFMYHIKNGIKFNLWLNACRNLIDVDDFYGIADYILTRKDRFNRKINIANPENYTVTEIVAKIVGYIGNKANFTALERGGCFDINISDTLQAVEVLKIDFGANYLESLLHKYYPKNEL